MRCAVARYSPSPVYSSSLSLIHLPPYNPPLYPPSTDNPIVSRSARPHESLLVSSQTSCASTFFPLRYRSDLAPSNFFPSVSPTHNPSPLTKICSLTHPGWSNNVQQPQLYTSALHLMSPHWSLALAPHHSISPQRLLSPFPRAEANRICQRLSPRAVLAQSHG